MVLRVASLPSMMIQTPCSPPPPPPPPLPPAMSPDAPPTRPPGEPQPREIDEGGVPQAEIWTPDNLSAQSKRRRSVTAGRSSSRRRSATPIEHITLLEHKCRLNGHERIAFESQVAQLEAELGLRSEDAEAEAERANRLERELASAANAAAKELREVRAAAQRVRSAAPALSLPVWAPQA